MSEGKVRSRLAEAGWESIVFEGSSCWRSPDTGRMYPHVPAGVRTSQVEKEGER